MNTTLTDEVVLKQDVLGRVKTPKARREELLDEFERSGLPGLNYVHLRPSRTKLLRPEQPLRAYRCSSWPEYLKRPG